MDTFRSDIDVSFLVEHLDDSGNAIVPDSITYLCVDKDGVEIVASTSVGVVGSSPTEITIPAVSNAITIGSRNYREIKIELVVGTDSFFQNYEYVIQKDTILVKNENSFQAYGSAVIAAMDIVDMTGWDSAMSDQNKRKTALIESYNNICKLSFEIDEFYWDGFDGSIVDLTDINNTDFDLLPEDFINALNKAQVAEANHLLGGDPQGDKRRLGIMSETIGESSAMFRMKKPLVMPICDKAMKILSQYVVFVKRIGR